VLGEGLKGLGSTRSVEEVRKDQTYINFASRGSGRRIGVETCLLCVLTSIKAISKMPDFFRASSTQQQTEDQH